MSPVIEPPPKLEVPGPKLSTAVSPTGTPVIPPKVVPVLGAVCAVAAAVVVYVPEHTWGWRIAAGVVGLCAMFGIVSPGWRK